MVLEKYIICLGACTLGRIRAGGVMGRLLGDGVTKISYSINLGALSRTGARSDKTFAIARGHVVWRMKSTLMTLEAKTITRKLKNKLSI